MSRMPSVEAWPGGVRQKSAVLAARYADVADGRLQNLGWEYLAGSSLDWRGDDTGCLLVHLYGFDEAARLASPYTGGDHPTGRLNADLGWPGAYYDWRLELFTRLDQQECVGWATRSLEAIPIGANLQTMVDQLLCDVLSNDPEIGVQRLETGPAVGVLETTHALYRRWLDGGGEPSIDALRAAVTEIPRPLTRGGYIASRAIQSVGSGCWTLNIFLKALEMAGSGADAYVSALLSGLSPTPSNYQLCRRTDVFAPRSAPARSGTAPRTPTGRPICPRQPMFSDLINRHSEGVDGEGYRSSRIRCAN